MRHHKQALFGAVAFLQAVCCLAALTEGVCHVTVREGSSIQLAVSLAPAGSVVCVEPGTWSETIVIAKSVTLRGTGGSRQTTIRGDVARPVIRIEGNERVEVAIKGISVTWGPIGIAVVGAARVAITDTDVRNCGAGIAVSGSSQVTITGCWVGRCQTHGIFVTDSSIAIVRETRIEQTSGWLAAVYVENSASLSMASSIISRNEGSGVWAGNAARVDIRDTEIRDNARDGVGVGGTAQLTMTGSVIVGNKWRGIALGDSAHATLVSNRVIRNGMYGVFLYELPCAVTDRVFRGYLSGHGNTIPGLTLQDVLAGDANEKGATCPPELLFLTTEEGGTLDRRQ